MKKTKPLAHHTVITNLQKQLEDKQLEYQAKYNFYIYNEAIKKTIDENYGKEPRYLLDFSHKL